MELVRHQPVGEFRPRTPSEGTSFCERAGCKIPHTIEGNQVCCSAANSSPEDQTWFFAPIGPCGLNPTLRIRDEK